MTSRKALTLAIANTILILFTNGIWIIVLALYYAFKCISSK